MIGRAPLVVVAALFAAAPVAAAPDAELRADVETANGAPLVGERIDIRLRGRFNLSIAHEEMIAPQSKDFDWIQIERDKWTPTNGLEKLYERHLLAFPRRSGRLVIPPFVDRITVLDEDGRRSQRDVATAPVTIDVAPSPAGLPADTVELADAWSSDPAALQLGATVERTVTLRVEGADPTLVPSLPQIREWWLISFAGPEERTLERTPLGIVTTVRRHWSLRPAKGEIGVLPPIRVAWFNRATRREQLAEIAPRRIGFAGFAQAARRNWTSEFPVTASMKAAFLAGFLLGIGFLARGLRLGERQHLAEGMRRCARGIVPLDLIALTIARFRGNPEDMRKALVRRLAVGKGGERDRRALERLDRHFFAGEGDAAGFDFRY